MTPEVVSTGNAALDAALGTGGWPRGRICQVYAPELHLGRRLLAESIGQARRSAVIDLQRVWEGRENLRVCRPEAGEAIGLLSELAGKVDLLIFDHSDLLASEPAQRQLTVALRKLGSQLSRSVALFLTQTRPSSFGEGEQTGANCLKFYSSIRIDLRETGGMVAKNKFSPPFVRFEPWQKATLVAECHEG